jgi:HemY protein
MKRLVFILIAVLLIALSIAWVSYSFGSGYVIVSFADISIETSLIFALGVLILSYLLLNYTLRVFRYIIGLPLYLRMRKKQRRAEHARQSLIKGMTQLIEGHFAIAENALIKHAPLSDTSMLNYLMAAHAAQQLNAFDRRDGYLQQALKTSPESEVAVILTQAELQLANQQYDETIVSLLHADRQSPKNDYIKKLLATAYQYAGNWNMLGGMLDELRKNRLLSGATFQAVEIDTYIGLLQASNRALDAQSADALWQRVPKNLKENGRILQIYAELLIKVNRHGDAENLIRNYLNRNWHEPLVQLFCEIQSNKPQQQLDTAESWLPQHRDSAILLLVLGKLCLKNKLWGKAKTYLETSLSLTPLADTYLQLAMLLDTKMQEAAKAQQLYQQGLKLAVTCNTEKQDSLQTIKKSVLSLHVSNTR